MKTAPTKPLLGTPAGTKQKPVLRGMAVLHEGTDARTIPRYDCVIYDVCCGCENFTAMGDQRHWTCCLQTEDKAFFLRKVLYHGCPIPENCLRYLEMSVMSQEGAEEGFDNARR